MHAHMHICITCVHVCVYTYVYGCMHVQLNYCWIILILCCFLLFAPELLMLEDPTAQFLDLFSALFMHSSLVIAFSLMNLNTIHMLTALTCLLESSFISSTPVYSTFLPGCLTDISNSTCLKLNSNFCLFSNTPDDLLNSQPSHSVSGNSPFPVA